MARPKRTSEESQWDEPEEVQHISVPNSGWHQCRSMVDKVPLNCESSSTRWPHALPLFVYLLYTGVCIRSASPPESVPEFAPTSNPALSATLASHHRPVIVSRGVSNPANSTRKASPSGFFLLVEAHITSPVPHADGGVFRQYPGRGNWSNLSRCAHKVPGPFQDRCHSACHLQFLPFAGIQCIRLLFGLFPRSIGVLI